MLSINYSSPIVFFLLAALSFLPSCAHKDVKVEEIPAKPWSFYQSGIRHDGYVETDITPSLGIKWMKPVVAGSRPYAPQEYASPAASKNVVYFASLRGKGVSAYKAKTGELIWHFHVEKGVESSPAIYENKLFFGANDGYIYSVDAASGKLVWRYNAGVEILSSPIAEGGILFFTASNDILYALDSVTGDVLWRYKGGSRGGGIYSIRLTSSPAYNDGMIYVGFSDGSIVAVVAFDGSILWKKKLSKGRGVRFADIDASPVIDGNVILVSSYDSGFHALDIKNGNTLWKFDARSSSTPSYDNTRVYITDSSGKIFALDKKSGAMQWEYVVDEGVPTSTVRVGDFLLFGSSHNKMYLLKADSGELINTTKASSGFSASPIYYDEMIYAISNAGYIYALK
ncbi:MAG: PQQ-binding-like beta-propeller repeat protein [Proteobacteria bacterium]|nr:PQQ-binding-like beta-propeller repeat protein [Pseudomonadota bacterium]